MLWSTAKLIINSSVVDFSSNATNSANIYWAGAIAMDAIPLAGTPEGEGNAGLQINDSSVTFRGNWSSRTGVNIYCAAIAMGGGRRATIRRSYLTFEGNTVMTSKDAYGGALFMEVIAGSGGNPNMVFETFYSTVIFKDNKAIASGRSFGGAFHIDGAAMKYTFNNGYVEFSSNSAAAGGAMALTQGDTEISGNSMVMIIGNRATGYTGGSGKNISGGAIMLSGSESGAKATLTLSNNYYVLIASNTASGGGGAIRVYGEGTLELSNESRQTMIFADNYMSSGPLSGEGTPNDIYIDGWNATGNRTLKITNAGDLYTLSGIYVINKAKLVKEGGGMWTLSGWSLVQNLFADVSLAGPMTVQYATFTWDLANQAEGRIVPVNGSSFYFINSSVTFSNARGQGIGERRGGAISYYVTSQVLKTTMSFLNSRVSFVNNWVYQDGGAVVIFGSQDGYEVSFLVNKSEVVFSSNQAKWGGGMYIRGSVDSHIVFATSTVKFEHNKAANGGAGLLIGNNNTTVWFFRSSVNFSSNVAMGGEGYGGGGIQLNDTNMGLYFRDKSYLVFHGNSVNANYGGGIDIKASSLLEISHSTAIFTNNFASGGGGAIRSVGNITFINSSVAFYNNSAGNNAGAAYVAGNVNFTDSYVNFTSNTSITNATGVGGLAIINGSLNISGGNVIFIGNVGGPSTLDTDLAAGGLSISGGNLNIDNNATVIFSSNSMRNAGSKQGGTAMNLAAGGKATIRNSTFTFDNNTAYYGGASFRVAGAGAVMRVINSFMSFDNERAAGDSAQGGAIQIMKAGVLSVEYSTYIMRKSYAKTSGGALYTSEGISTMTFAYSYLVVEDSLAGYGGAIDFDSGNGRIWFFRTTAEFIRNEATVSYGGVTSIRGDAANNFTIDRSSVSFTSNTAQTYGGAIYQSVGTFLSQYSTVTFVDNKAVTNGLSIYQNGGTANYQYSDVEFLLHHDYTPSKTIIYANAGTLNFGVSGNAGNSGIVRFTSNTSTSYGHMWGVAATNANGVNFYNITIAARHNYAAGAGGFYYTANEATNSNYTKNSIPANMLFSRAVDISTNVSATDGGAIAVNGGTVAVFLDAANIKQSWGGNVAGGAGGAIFLTNGGQFYIAPTGDSDFSGNEIVFTKNVMRLGRNVNISNDIFVGSDGNATDQQAKLTIDFATGGSGKVYFYSGVIISTSGQMDVSKGGANSLVYFSGLNQIYNSGGVIFNNANTTIENATFTVEGNSFSNVLTRKILFNSLTMTVRDTLFQVIDNSSYNGDSKGLVEFSSNDQEVLFINSRVVVSGNTTYGTGGFGGAGLFFTGTGVIRFDKNTNARFVNNGGNYIGPTGGGAIYVGDGKQVIFEGTTLFDNNIVANLGNGGAVIVRGNNSQTPTILAFGGSVIFSNNSSISNGAGAYGGAILSTGEGGGVAIASFSGVNATFYNNGRNSNYIFKFGGAIATLGGGYLWVDNSTLVFRNNIATYGGALYLDSNSNTPTISRSSVTFSNNIAAEEAAAIYISTGSKGLTVNDHSILIFEGVYSSTVGLITANSAFTVDNSILIFRSLRLAAAETGSFNSYLIKTNGNGGIATGTDNFRVINSVMIATNNINTTAGSAGFLALSYGGMFFSGSNVMISSNAGGRAERWFCLIARRFLSTQDFLISALTPPLALVRAELCIFIQARYLS
jgi:predicted outer membrane repeat protein